MNDHVIYTGTLSKTIMPAMRIGCMVMPQKTITRFNELSEMPETGLPLLS
ncbi:hypothetical protein [Rahnella sp. NRRL B-41462]|nr:hypothetical protein [Rahnella sp. NRRL B-41462]